MFNAAFAPPSHGTKSLTLQTEIYDDENKLLRFLSIVFHYLIYNGYTTATRFGAIGDPSDE